MNEKIKLLRFLEELDEYDLAVMVYDRSFTETVSEIPLKRVSTVCRDWYDFIDDTCSWGASWVGRSIMHSIANLTSRHSLASLIEAWNKFFSKEEPAEIDSTFRRLLPKHKTRKLVSDIKNKKKPVSEIASLFNWDERPEGFLFWEEVARKQQYTRYVNLVLTHLVDSLKK
jgi:hypothetical protein